MHVELITKQDFITMKTELINELKNLFQKPLDQKQWMKSADVMKMLQCSPGTLQNLRINGTLPFTKIGGTTYYAYNDVMNLLEKNKKNAA